MRQIGTVESLYNNTAQIRIKRASACGENCSSCKGGCVPTEILVKAKNHIGAKKGDIVAIEMESKKVLGAAALVYIIPLIFLIAGYILGEYLTKNENWGILIGVAATFFVYLIIIAVDRKMKNKFDINIVKIINV